MEPCRSVSARVPFFRSPASTTAAKPRSAVSSVTAGPLPLRHLSDHYATEDTLKHLISTVSTPLDLYVARPTTLKTPYQHCKFTARLYNARLVHRSSHPQTLYQDCEYTATEIVHRSSHTQKHYQHCEYTAKFVRRSPHPQTPYQHCEYTATLYQHTLSKPHYCMARPTF